MLPRSLPPISSVAEKRPALCDNPSERTSKRRASRACLSCRSRKVRCDVVSGGHPCTNCRLDSTQCVLKESNRGRRPTIAVASPARLSPSSLEYHTPTPVAPDDYLVTLSFEDQQARALAIEDLNDSGATIQPGHMHCTSGLQDATNESAVSPERMSWDLRLPAFIRPLPQHITLRDADYLADKDALTIPDRQFRLELLRTYVYIVHPFMPILDLDNFLAPIFANDGNKPVSLLLFQAVMFSGITFVDANTMQAAGYGSRRAVRKLFYNRVRLLYGLDCEPDRIALFQALLLMSFWYDNPHDEKDTWYWMGITLSLGQVIGLHRDPSPLTISDSEKRLRRRLWWSCFMRDRLLALGVRRPARIRDDEFNVPELNLDDFTIDTPSDCLLELLGESSDLTGPDPQARTVMAIMCIELSELCIHLGQILQSQYTILSSHSDGADFFLVPKRSEKQRQDLAECDRSLMRWLEKQDARTRYVLGRPGQSGIGSSDHSRSFIRLHQALLFLIYYTAQVVLHKPQAFVSGTLHGDRKLSRERVTEGAVAVTKMAYELQCTNQLRFLSTSSVPAFLSASLIHLLDIRSPDDELRNASIGRFYQCVQVLHQLQDMYSSAVYAARFIQTVLKRTGIKIPMLRIGSTTDEDSLSADLTPGFYPCGRNRTSAACYRHAHTAQPISPSFSAFEMFPSVNGHMGNEAHYNGELCKGSPFPNMWNDLDILLPALIDFNADPYSTIDLDHEGRAA